MGETQSFYVQPGVVNECAAAADQVANGVMDLADAVTKVPTTPQERYGDWMLGDRSIDLIAPWDDLLLACSADIRTFGQNLAESSAHYARTDAEHSSVYDGILR